jgi:hypothetical protein
MSTQTEWTEQYLREAIRDEIELASVKLRHRVVMPRLITIDAMLTPEPPRAGRLISPGAARQTFGATPLPRWRRSWAAGQLIGELSLEIRQDPDEGTVQASAVGQRRGVIEAYADHPSKDAAIWAALVRMAIRVCTEAREQ